MYVRTQTHKQSHFGSMHAQQAVAQRGQCTSLSSNPPVPILPAKITRQHARSVACMLCSMRPGTAAKESRAPGREQSNGRDHSRRVPATNKHNGAKGCMQHTTPYHLTPCSCCMHAMHHVLSTRTCTHSPSLKCKHQESKAKRPAIALGSTTHTQNESLTRQYASARAAASIPCAWEIACVQTIPQAHGPPSWAGLYICMLLYTRHPTAGAA